MYGALRRVWTQLRQLLVTINILAVLLGSRQLFVSGAPLRQVTYDVDMSDPDTVTHLSAIVDSLENLDVLDKSHASCYTVDKIVKSERLLDSRTWIISVNLYVQQLRNDVAGHPEEDQDVDSKSPTKACPNVDVGADLLADADDMMVEVSLSNYTSNGTVVHFIMDNVTTIPVANDKEKEGRLSRTQIMVISTCSTVIGLFFLVALAMRIRNYMKRYRAEQQNRRTAFRTSSSGLRGSDADDNSPQSANPPIMVPPVPGRRHFHIDGRSNDVTQSSLRRSLRLDHKPLLIVTSASAPSSPVFHGDGAICVYSNPNTGYAKQIAQRSVNGTEAERDDINQIMHHGYHAPNARHTLNAQYTDTDLDNGYYSAVNLGSPFGVQRDNESCEKLLQEDEICGEINVPATIQNAHDDWSLSGEEHWPANELQVYTIGHSGLTQSDSSITSSRNPPYAYGNQCEYQGITDLWITGQMAGDPDPLLNDPCQQPDNGIERDFCDVERLEKNSPDSLNSGSDTYQQQQESGLESGQGSRPLIPSLKCRKTSDSSESRAQRKSVTFSTDGDDVCEIDDCELVDDVYDDDDDDDGDDDDGDDADHQVKEDADWFRNKTDPGTKEEKSSLLGREPEPIQPTYV